MKTKELGIYVRVSTEKQKEHGYSIGQQINLGKSYAEQVYPNYNINLYNDEGYSGSSLQRPALQRLLQDIENKSISILIFTDLDRLTRGGVAHTEYLLTHCLKHNCVVKCLYQNVDITDPDEEFTTFLHSLLAKREVRKVSIRTKRGIEGGLHNGKYTIGGALPLGYKRNQDKTISIVESEAVIINYIFSSILDLKPVHCIVKEINDKFDVRVSDKQVIRIIKNKRYIGIVEFNDTIFNNLIPSIIDAAVFDDVQIKYKQCIGYKENKFNYPFSNKVLCASCNEFFENKSGYKKNKKYFYLVCSNCNRWINQKKMYYYVEDEVLKAYRKFKLDYCNPKYKLAIEESNKQIKILDQRLKKLQFALLDELITKEEFMVINKELKTELKYHKKNVSIENENIESFHNSSHHVQHLVIQKYLDTQVF